MSMFTFLRGVDDIAGRYSIFAGDEIRGICQSLHSNSVKNLSAFGWVEEYPRIEPPKSRLLGDLRI